MCDKTLVILGVLFIYAHLAANTLVKRKDDMCDRTLVIFIVLFIYAHLAANTLVTSSLEFLVKQLYILHRKPFLLQMFGSIANNLENSDQSDPFKVGKMLSKVSKNCFLV